MLGGSAKTLCGSGAVESYWQQHGFVGRAGTGAEGRSGTVGWPQQWLQHGGRVGFNFARAGCAATRGQHQPNGIVSSKALQRTNARTGPESMATFYTCWPEGIKAFSQRALS